MNGPHRPLPVDATASGPSQRLDRHLVLLGLAPSRRGARQLIAQGAVSVNGVIAGKSALVTEQDRVEVIGAGLAAPLQPNPELTVEVLFMDRAVVVVNKPGGLPCHPLSPSERNTVMNAVAARFPEVATVGDRAREGGLIHRLDNGTSGALLIARTPLAFERLRHAVRRGLIVRRYRALVSGLLCRPLELTQPIAHRRHNSRKMVATGRQRPRHSRRPRAALTLIEPVGRTGRFTLVEVFPRTGSRHQIRVHLAGAGHPIVGDTLYGGPASSQLGPGRFWLHLAEVTFDSPASGRITVEAPLPSELVEALASAAGRLVTRAL